MANYGTIAGAFELYPRIGSVSTVTSNMVLSYLNRQEALIDARLANRHTVPVAGGPPLLKDVAESLAIGRMILRLLPLDKESARALADAFLEPANEILDALASGAMTLVDSAGARVTLDQTTTTPWSSTKGYVPTWSPILDETGIGRDRDRVQDDEDDRRGQLYD